jgi:hypothetical protein
MSADTRARNGASPRHRLPGSEEGALACPEDALIMSLERDQLVAETSRPVPKAQLSSRALAGLWALRVFVVIVSAMVIYTFFAQLQ